MQKVLLAAIAKDEAAYLPEWIYHHLKLGFYGVQIYINKTSDNSREILERISERYPCVKYTEADYIYNLRDRKWSSLIRDKFEKSNPFQSRAFADIFFRAKQDGYTHVAYFDIDEYLYLSCGDVNKYLENIKTKIIKFKWFQNDGDDNLFTPTIKCRLSGEKTVQVKYILSTNLDDFCFSNTHHVVSLTNKNGAYLAGYGRLEPNESHRRHAEWADDAFIIHRLYRSKVEYLAKIYGGDNIRDKNSASGLKLNRPGWLQKNKHSIKFNADCVEKRLVEYWQFIDSCEIFSEVEDAQKQVIEKAKKVEKIYFDFIDEAISLSRVMRGTGLPALVKQEKV